jgi:hypothetical protein
MDAYALGSQRSSPGSASSDHLTFIRTRLEDNQLSLTLVISSARGSLAPCAVKTCHQFLVRVLSREFASLVQVHETRSAEMPDHTHQHSYSTMASAHLVAHILPGWGMYQPKRSVLVFIYNVGIGHTKPFLALIAHMFELQPSASFTVTLLTSAIIIPKIKREMQLMPGPISSALK